MPVARPRRLRAALALTLSLAVLAAPALGASAAASEAAAPRTGETAWTVEGGDGSIAQWFLPAEIAEGEDITIRGEGWFRLDGAPGSVISVLINRPSGAAPTNGAAVDTTRDVVSEATGEVLGDKRLHAQVLAADDGSWSVTIPYPTPENSSLLEPWRPGETHGIRLLSGSAVAGDVTRTTFGAFTIRGGTTEPTAPDWPHETVSATDEASGATAVAWVQKDVSAGSGGTIRLAGTGWVTRAGDGASTVAVKINRGEGRQYTRSGADIVAHPSASGDDTIWALLAPADPEGHPHVFEIAPDGSFDIEIDAPAGLDAGQYLSLLFQSGRFDAADAVRSVTSGFLTVGGVPYVEDAPGGEEPTCVTDAAPSIRIENTEASLGGLLHVTGAGWCHPEERRGGSVIAVKIDEGAYSRLDDELHQNVTIWAIIEADAADGTFDTFLQLPDGTESGPNGSWRAFPEGAHSLRLLTGSLKSGDAARTLRSEDFVVGEYRPLGAPDPVDVASLNRGNAGGVTATATARALTVTVPGAGEGDWVFLTPFAADGSPRYPWLATWFRADAAGRVTAPLAGVTMPTGPFVLLAQSGDRETAGAILGWTTLTVTAEKPKEEAQTAEEAPARPAVALAARAPRPAPLTVPAAPFATAEGLTAGNAGEITALQAGTVVTLILHQREPGDWVYLYAYSEPIPVGWIQVDEGQRVRVDIAALPPGEHRIAVLDAEGALIGWAPAHVEGEEAEDVPEDETPSAPAEEPAAAAPAPQGGPSASDWLLIAGAGGIVLIGLVVVLAVSRRRAGGAE